MKDQAQVVIVGGGIVGANIAYHLAKLGWTDVILFEKGEIASGESSHAAGLVTQFATSQTLMQFRKYSIELYSELGLFDHVGSLRVASTPDQFKELQRSVSRAKAIGMDVEVISPAEALRIMPQLSGENLYGAIYLPRDGHLDPYTTTTSMVRFAKEMGVTVYTGVRVTGIELSPKGEVQTCHHRPWLGQDADRGQRGGHVGAAGGGHGRPAFPDHAGGSSAHCAEGSGRP